MTRGSLGPRGGGVEATEVVRAEHHFEGLGLIKREELRCRHAVGGAVATPPQEARDADPFRHVLVEVPRVKVRSPLVRNAVPDRYGAFTRQHCRMLPHW